MNTAGGRRLAEMLADPSVTGWLKKGLRDLEGRDPLDAYQDARELFAERVERLRAMGYPVRSEA